jgi:hypothetical protein
MALARKIAQPRGTTHPTSPSRTFVQPFGENAKGAEDMVEVDRQTFAFFIRNLSVRGPLDKLRSDVPTQLVEYYKNTRNIIVAARTLGDEVLRRYFINQAMKYGYVPPPEPPEPEPVPILSLWNTNPALVLVLSTDLAKFANGDLVTVAGVQPPWATLVNGQHTIANVGVGGDWFELVGVDLSLAMTTIGDPGMTVTPQSQP